MKHSKTEQPSQLDDSNFEALRFHVEELLAQAADVINGKDLVTVLDVAPQDHAGIRPRLNVNARVITLDIDPESGADIIGDLCTQNARVPSESIDFVICTEVLEHVSQPFDAVAEIYRMLHPGGVAFFSAPFNFRIHGPLPDNWRFSEHGWRQLLTDFAEVTVQKLETPDRPLMPIHYNVIAVK